MIKFALFCTIASLVLSACGNNAIHSGPQSLTGTWKSSDKSLTAHIVGDRIQIDFVDDANSRSLYWKGSFDPAAANGAHIISKGDTEAMDASLLGSQDDTKKFVYKNGELTFSLSIMGTTKTMRLVR